MRPQRLHIVLLIGAAIASVGCSLIVESDGRSCATSFSMSGQGGCLLNADGELYCWGQSLINGTGRGVDEPLPSRVSGLADVRDVHVGEAHACAVHGDTGQISCWGRNDLGQVGDGTQLARATPAPVIGITEAVIVRTGQFHTCAVHGSNRRVRCWGDNEHGQLGDEVPAPRLDASGADVADLSGVIDLAVGDAVTCVIHQDRTVSCWGRNVRGELGDGTTVTERPTPGPVIGLSSVTQISAGCDRHLCAIADGRASCWGDNSYGQLGTTGTNFSRQPVPVSLQSGASRISAGAYHTCAFNGTARVFCWGRNSSLQLGFESGDLQAVPTQVIDFPANSAVIDIQAGCSQSCARRQDGSIWCWGSNGYGELGDGTIASRLEPRPIHYECQ